ncbi:DUF4369 domain-containing protein [Marinifilum caeruleilacunae]|jgi:hypothetical protein|uniref:DUF4369 domain-containing protein n=1 Tax=Marinifilum caeruleilacunae TaxID=2499076 RepID=A0ABX1WTB0_9BACT|nr:hypothetical protein [Marinifilum caeruleilacunae]NOU59336.1 DUF4369 domain-containing protein [Marinifilum caeruleilacunae]
MKLKMKTLAALLSILMMLSACNSQKKEAGFTLNGTIHGYENGTLLLKKDFNDPNPVKYEVKDGKFTITGDLLDEPKDLFMEIKEKDVRFGLYVENGVNTLEVKLTSKTHPMMGEMFSMEVIKMEASIVNEHEKEIREKDQQVRDQYYGKNMEKMASLTDEDINAYKEASANVNREFIKAHPDAYYSAYLALRLAHGEDSEGVREVLAMLDPKMDNSLVRALKTKLKDMELTDVDPSEIIKAKNVSYKVEKAFAGSNHTNIVYMGMFSNDNVCTLTKDGSIQIVDAKGKEISKFKPSLASLPTSIAVDQDDQIYVMYPLTKKVSRKFRGRTMEIDETYAFECSVFDTKGELKSTFELEGIVTATGARVAEGKLLVADWQSRIIGVFNAKTGAKEAALEDMRPCCAILDFSINAKNEVLVANLGAFRVQAYDLSGKNLLAFGKRGKSVNDFHGCCNPVSVAYLDNGAIVTVEKDPTRVKIFSSEGAKQIEGIEELVKGCSYIPMIVDSKDNLYLASPEKGMIKCVSVS